jgi:hypothetical protein
VRGRRICTSDFYTFLMRAEYGFKRENGNGDGIIMGVDDIKNILWRNIYFPERNKK